MAGRGRGDMHGKRLALAMMMAWAGSVAITAPSYAQAVPADTLKIDKKRIDAALAAMIADGRAAGTSALIWQDGREVYFGAAGMADRAANRPMPRDTLAQIYSMTKPVTGLALRSDKRCEGHEGMRTGRSRWLRC